jgi:hypothetical protein
VVLGTRFSAALVSASQSQEGFAGVRLSITTTTINEQSPVMSSSSAAAAVSHETLREKAVFLQLIF